ncbi:NAD(P)-binding domain-containing protein [Pseudomonas parakoreensis]
MSTLPSLGFAGIGLMGLPMCHRLLAAGYPLTVWNRNPAKCAPLVEAGARQVATPAELCEHADVVMLCLADTAVVREVVFGAGGVVEGAKTASCWWTSPASNRRLLARWPPTWQAGPAWPGLIHRCPAAWSVPRRAAWRSWSVVR